MGTMRSCGRLARVVALSLMVSGVVASMVTAASAQASRW